LASSFLSLITRKRDQSEWISIQRPELAIVSIELWNRVQERQGEACGGVEGRVLKLESVEEGIILRYAQL
jgi:hypothetical protein